MSSGSPECKAVTGSHDPGCLIPVATEILIPRPAAGPSDLTDMNAQRFIPPGGSVASEVPEQVYLR